MGKKSTSIIKPNAQANSSSSSKKILQKNEKAIEKTNSIDDIFATSKKRKAQELHPISPQNKKSNKKVENSSTSKIGSSLKPKNVENEKGKKKISQIEDDDDDDEYDSDEFNSENYSTEEEEEEEDQKEEKNKVEEVFDPSSLIEIKKKIELQRSKFKLKQKSKDKQDDALFADSRGLGTGRKTEEGFTIYKEVDLQIDPTAGGTPLCPFDCDCCF
ncbi:uncharacterized protein I206_105628 [Kwoniella pini CBS 10737]|uniref:DUF1764 domain-containing protein n=1 Tax=Kwoniella pini CBS 10737 TaxID=1296096 RepID=A0A1B9I3P7_9TREE|nr:uncharacterized protein I206_03472 [Kwoniella pini CBS 10737]OCF50153.1 hypothetical protein I206_03472 [Kwoniella pini CBS 10737]